MRSKRIMRSLVVAGTAAMLSILSIVVLIGVVWGHEEQPHDEQHGEGDGRCDPQALASPPGSNADSLLGHA